MIDTLGIILKRKNPCLTFLSQVYALADKFVKLVPFALEFINKIHIYI